MINNLTIASAATLLVWATPAPEQLDGEGMGLLNDINQCVEQYAFEKDDGIKSPEVIADQSMAACKDKSIAFEEYAVRHSVNMTDQVRNDLRSVSHKMAIRFVLLNRKAGRIHAPNQ